MSTTHTPEPWYVETEHPASVAQPHHTHSDLVVVTPCGRITQTGDTIARRHANARLIAAAPALLLALESIEPELYAMTHSEQFTAFARTAFGVHLARVRHAITKAKPSTKG